MSRWKWFLCALLASGPSTVAKIVAGGAVRGAQEQRFAVRGRGGRESAGFGPPSAARRRPAEAAATAGGGSPTMTVGYSMVMPGDRAGDARWRRRGALGLGLGRRPASFSASPCAAAAWAATSRAIGPQSATTKAVWPSAVRNAPMSRALTRPCSLRRPVAVGDAAGEGAHGRDLTTGEPRCLRASGCTSRCSQRCRRRDHLAGEQRRRREGDCGLLPMLTSCTGAGVPQSLPSRMGSCGTPRDRGLSAARRSGRAPPRCPAADQAAGGLPSAPGGPALALRRCGRSAAAQLRPYERDSKCAQRWLRATRQATCIPEVPPLPACVTPDVTPHTNQDLELAR